MFKDDHWHHSYRDNSSAGIKDVCDLGVLIKEMKREESSLKCFRGPCCDLRETEQKRKKENQQMQNTDVIYLQSDYILTIDLTDLMISKEAVTCS